MYSKPAGASAERHQFRVAGTPIKTGLASMWLSVKIILCLAWCLHRLRKVTGPRAINRLLLVTLPGVWADQPVFKALMSNQKNRRVYSSEKFLANVFQIDPDCTFRFLIDVPQSSLTFT
jgi:hypothetical protein